MAAGPDLDELVDRLRARGERVTSARRQVLAALLAAGHHHATAEQLAASVQASNPDVNLSTVYRTLDVLEATGLVIRAGFTDHTATTYHLVDDPHHHAVCDRCGTVVDLPASAFDPVVRRLERDHGFAARPSHLTVGGLCAACRPTR
jgi:Fe2+ or Zn2+ uptake regulation protein